VVDLENLFSGFQITSAVEVILGANLERSSLNRFTWKVEDNNQIESRGLPTIKDLSQVVLKPMEIRSFILGVSPKNKNF